MFSLGENIKPNKSEVREYFSLGNSKKQLVKSAKKLYISVQKFN